MILFNPNRFLPGQPITVTKTDNQGTVVCTEVYQINPNHRNNNPLKSQWTIHNHEEAGVFGWSLEHDCFEEDYYWGVLYNGVSSAILGITTSGLDTKIARFECSIHPRIWHGYPVDYVNDPQHDCPGRTVLLKWAAMGIITKSKIAKLIGGQGWRG